MKKQEQKYKNIPVRPDIYEKVQLISEANGFGERGLGAQVAHWVGQELPECAHQKTPVEIEYFTAPASASLSAIANIKRTGYFCETCKRVYARVDEAELAEQDGKKLLAAIKVKGARG